MRNLTKNRSINSSRTRKSSGESSELKRGLSKSKVSGGDRRGSAIRSASGDSSASLLNPAFGLLSPFQILKKNLEEGNHHHDGLDMKTGLTLLYGCLKKHEAFKDNKDWKSVPPIHEVAHYLLSKIRLMKGAGNDWKFARDRNGNYSLIFYRTHQNLCRNHMMPLDWLPLLQRKNLKLHDVVVELIGSIAKVWKLWVVKNSWNEFYIMDKGSHWTDDEKDQIMIDYDVDKYEKKGIAKLYEKRLKAVSVSSVKSLKEKLSCAWGKTEAERSVLRWCYLGLEVLNNPENIQNYTTPALDIDMYDDGPPVSAEDLYGFPWSFGDNIYSWMESSLTDTEGNIGMANIVSKVELFPSKKTKIVIAKPIKTLAQFMEEGFKIYSRYYRKRLGYARHKQTVELTKHLKDNSKDKALLINILT